MKSVRRDGLAFLAFVAMALACFGRLTLAPGSLIVDPERPPADLRTRLDVPSVGNDLTRLFLPHHLWVGRAVRELGRLPLWDDRGFGGRPLVGNPQAGVFYPPAWLAWWSGSPAALGWLTFAHVVLLAAGTYALARTLGLCVRCCLFAGLCVQGLPFVLGHVSAGHVPHVWSASWIPWVFEATVRARRGKRSGWLALPPLLALSFVAGHPQEWYLLVLGLGVVAVHDLMGPQRGGRRVLAWAGVFGLSLGLVGLELLPILLARSWTGPRLGATLPLADRYHLGWANLAQWVSPHALGDPAGYFGPGNWWEAQASVGLIVAGLVLVACFGPRQRGLVRILLACVVLAGVFGAGRSLGLFWLAFQVLPGMTEFRAPARVLFLVQPLVAILAAIGLENVARGGSRVIHRAFPIGLGLLGLACLWAVLTASASASLPVVVRVAVSVGSAPGFWVAMAGVGGAWAGMRLGCPPGQVAGLLALAALAELVVYGIDVVRASPPERFLSAGPIDDVLRQDPGTRLRAKDTLYGDGPAAALGLAKTNVGDGFQVRHAAGLVERLYPMFHPAWDVRGEPLDDAVEATRRLDRQAILDRMSVGWLVDEGPPDPAVAWSPVASGTWRGSAYTVYRNPEALPRAYVVPRAAVGTDHRSLRLYDPRSVVLMDTDPLIGCEGVRQPFRAAAFDGRDPDRSLIHVRTEAPGLLVVADTWMPGWSAWVDGRPAPLLRGNHAQRVVVLREPGEHVIELRYRTPGLDLGLWLSGASLLAWGVLASLRLGRVPTPG